MDTVDTVPVLKESLMTTVDLRSVGSVYEPVLDRKNTNNEDVNGVFSGHVHLFLDQNHVGATDGPHTPFLTVLTMTEGERPIQPRQKCGSEPKLLFQNTYRSSIVACKIGIDLVNIEQINYSFLDTCNNVFNIHMYEQIFGITFLK